MATAVTVQQLLLNRQYTPEQLEISKTYRLFHTCKIARQHHHIKDNVLIRGEKLHLYFENSSDKATHLTILLIDSNKNVYSLFPTFTSEWEKMNFHYIQEGSNIVIQIDTSSLPFDNCNNNDSQQQHFQIVAVSVVKSTIPIRNCHDNSICFSTTINPVFQNFEFFVNSNSNSKTNNNNGNI
ncbi:hypothetical protein ABK040_016543 [Willaertia magna]